MSTVTRIAPAGMTAGKSVSSTTAPQDVKDNLRLSDRKEELAKQQQELRNNPSASAEDLNKVVEHLKDLVPESVKRDLQFSIDKDSGRTVVKVVDAKTGETIRQVPSEEVLHLKKALEQQSGFLVNVTA